MPTIINADTVTGGASITEQPNPFAIVWPEGPPS